MLDWDGDLGCCFWGRRGGHLRACRSGRSIRESLGALEEDAVHVAFVFGMQAQLLCACRIVAQQVDPWVQQKKKKKRLVSKVSGPQVA